LQDQPRRTLRPPMGEEKRDNGVGDPFKLFLKESLTQQINFDIPLFEGQIDVNVVDKWLNLLEGYFYVHNISYRKNITFALLNVIPHVKYWWDTLYEKKEMMESTLFVVAPTWGYFRNVIKEKYYPIGSYDDLYTRWTTL
jgi:hypothetical protein